MMRKDKVRLASEVFGGARGDSGARGGNGLRGDGGLELSGVCGLTCESTLRCGGGGGGGGGAGGAVLEPLVSSESVAD